MSNLCPATPPELPPTSDRLWRVVLSWLPRILHAQYVHPFCSRPFGCCLITLIHLIADVQIQALPGLDKLIAKSTDPQWTHHRRSAGLVQWRPFVDDVLRKK